MIYYKVEDNDFKKQGVFTLDGDVVKVPTKLKRSYGTLSFQGVKVTPKDGVKYLKVLVLITYHSSYTKFSLEDSDTWAPKEITVDILKQWTKEIAK